MKYSRLGNTGLVVSRLSFGAMTFTAGNRPIPSIFKVEADSAERMVGMALDAGINHFDTADLYALGQSEEILGRLLKPHRQKLVIGTKVGGRMSADLLDSGLSRRHILASIDQSLKRLGTDWIDLYLVHFNDPHTPIEETLLALDSVVRAGKVRYLGFSNWPAWMVSAAMEIMKSGGLAPFSHGQMYYSPICRDLEMDIVPMMRRYGLGLTVWGPLAGGFLSGKFRRGLAPASDTRFGDVEVIEIDRERGYDLIEILHGIAGRHEATPAQVVLAWILARDYVSSIILGATKANQLADTLRAAELQLTADELDSIDAAAPPYRPYPHWVPDRFADFKLRAALEGDTK